MKITMTRMRTKRLKTVYLFVSDDNEYAAISKYDGVHKYLSEKV